MNAPYVIEDLSIKSSMMYHFLINLFRTIDLNVKDNFKIKSVMKESKKLKYSNKVIGNKIFENRVHFDFQIYYFG